jgi:hypothetical protein
MSRAIGFRAYRLAHYNGRPELQGARRVPADGVVSGPSVCLECAFEEWGEPCHCGLAPHPDCSCGYHATYEPYEALCDGPILALVEGQGVVVPHEDGWRAQYVRVLALAVPDESWTPRLPSWTHEVPVYVWRGSLSKAPVDATPEEVFEWVARGHL